MLFSFYLDWILALTTNGINPINNPNLYNFRERDITKEIGEKN